MFAEASKLWKNFGPRAFAALGPRQYARVAINAAAFAPQALRTRNMNGMDRQMAIRPLYVRGRGGRFIVDGPEAHRVIGDDVHPFGLVRELVIRNCYLRYGIEHVFDGAKTVLDLGANIGVFSTMAGVGGKKVVSVEVMPKFAAMVHHHMRLNGVADYAVENCFVGAGGAFAGQRPESVGFATIPELAGNHGLAGFDLIKMDIEGSEFPLFADPSVSYWLSKTKGLCMEVHPSEGRVQDVIDRLTAEDFRVTTTNHLFHPVTDAQTAEFIYAVRQTG